MSEDWSKTPYADMRLPLGKPKTAPEFIYRRVLADLIPRLRAADALAEALRDLLDQGEGNPLYTSWGERVDDAPARAALAAYDAAMKEATLESRASS